MSQDIQGLVQSILEKGHLMSLATVDDGGPWVSDVVYMHDDDLNLYWISNTSTRHSKAILAETRVSATITLSNKSGEPNEGLQISGIAQKIEGDIPELAKQYQQKRGKPDPGLGEFLEKGKSWYRLTPSKIELIYEPLFGFKKQIYL